MDPDDSRELLKDVLGYLARKPPEPSKSPTTLRSRRDHAWMRAQAFMRHDAMEAEVETTPEDAERALGTLEKLFQYDSCNKSDSDTIPYPKLQALRSENQRSSRNLHSNLGSAIRMSKRKREHEAVIDEFSRWETQANKRRVLTREEPSVSGDIEAPEVSFVILARKRSVSLHQGLRTQWTCVCQKCSGLSVRLSLPPLKRSSQEESCFEIFFGVRSLLTSSLQEAMITVKDFQAGTGMGASELHLSVLPEFAHICKCITESLDQRNCLHLLFDGGMFKRLRPKPKRFGNSPVHPTVSLATLFKRQQELQGGISIITLKGKRVLALVLAMTLLPFLETPWLQPSFSHSNIRFFQPLQDGELPNISKPFLDMEHAPPNSRENTDHQSGKPDPASYKHFVHPNASVLALGILLCELNYCTAVDTWQKGTKTARDVNASYYTSLDMLKTLENDTGVQYYLATKACLQWEYFPAGELTNFESASVQTLFYQNVIKPLEYVVFQGWRLRLEDLRPLAYEQNLGCWGETGQEFLREQRSKLKSSARDEDESKIPSLSSSDAVSLSFTPSNSNAHRPRQQSRCFQPDLHLTEPCAESLYLFDASTQSISQEGASLSDRWMDNLLISIDHHVDRFEAAEQYSSESVESGHRSAVPVRIAILDSGFDPKNPLLLSNEQRLDPRIKAVRNFVPETDPFDIEDEIGHGTHALGILLKVATCAEIYVAKVANRESLGRESYATITTAIHHAVTEWKVDIISMSFGIREYDEPMTKAISFALHSEKLLFAAASNDGANSGRAFPSKYPGVFCIHSTDGNGNPSAFNPTADDKDVNFSLLGERVRSHWPADKNGHNDIVKLMSGTSVATPIAAGLAATIISFVRQQEQTLLADGDLLGPWLADTHAMDAVLRSMVRQKRGAGYDYITPQVLLDVNSSREEVYHKIKDIKKHLYV